jgi:hypothetical protein
MHQCITHPILPNSCQLTNLHSSSNTRSKIKDPIAQVAVEDEVDAEEEDVAVAEAHPKAAEIIQCNNNSMVKLRDTNKIKVTSKDNSRGGLTDALKSQCSPTQSSFTRIGTTATPADTMLKTCTLAQPAPTQSLATFPMSLVKILAMVAKRGCIKIVSDGEGRK